MIEDPPLLLIRRDIVAHPVLRALARCKGRCDRNLVDCMDGYGAPRSIGSSRSIPPARSLLRPGGDLRETGPWTISHLRPNRTGSTPGRTSSSRVDASSSPSPPASPQPRRHGAAICGSVSWSPTAWFATSPGSTRASGLHRGARRDAEFLRACSGPVRSASRSMRRRRRRGPSPGDMCGRDRDGVVILPRTGSTPCSRGWRRFARPKRCSSAQGGQPASPCRAGSRSSGIVAQAAGW